jgi:hypothetical protein
VADHSDRGPEDLLLPSETARSLNVSESSLAKMRCAGGGPEYLKFGRTVRYEPRAVEEYKSAHRVRHTSDAARLPPRMTEAPRAESHPPLHREVSSRKPKGNAKATRTRSSPNASRAESDSESDNK